MAALGLPPLWDALSCGVLVQGERGRVVDANEAAARLFGLTREQLLGVDPLDPDWSAIEEGAGELRAPMPFARLSEGCPRRFVIRVGRTAGPWRWLRGDSAPLTAANGAQGVVCTLVDVTDEREGSALALGRLEKLQALRSAAMAMNSSHDLRLTLHVIVQQATVRLGVSAASIALLDERAGVLHHAAGIGFRGSGITRSSLALGQGYLGRAALERRRLHIPDLARAGDFVRAKLVEGEGFVAYFAVPLVSRNRLLGVLELFHRTGLQANHEWLEFLETLAEHAAVALDAGRMRTELSGLAATDWSLSALRELTPSQAAVLMLLAAGHSNRALGERLFLSENTVKFHLRNIYRKLGVQTRAAAVAAAVARGWL